MSHKQSPGATLFMYVYQRLHDSERRLIYISVKRDFIQLVKTNFIAKLWVVQSNLSIFCAELHMRQTCDCAEKHRNQPKC